METRFELEQLLLNELIFLQKKKEEYWNCHPDNPEGIDPIAEYNKTVHEIGAAPAQTLFPCYPYI